MSSSQERTLILASRSPRRQRLLKEAGFEVDVIPSDVDEVWPHCDTLEEGTCELALRKARAVSRSYRKRPVLAADTVVALADKVYGKPSSREHARQLITDLSGHTHDVVTGVAMVVDADSWTGSDRSKVTFRDLSQDEIEQYLDVADYTDKAGAYGIQEEGGRLVEAWTGRLDTIVGLPMNTVEYLWNQMRTVRDGIR